MIRPLTEELARAAATDAGNESMRTAGRTRWTVDDWRAAHKEFTRLIPHLPKEARKRLSKGMLEVEP